MPTPTTPVTTVFVANQKKARAFEFLASIKQALAAASDDITQVEKFNRESHVNDPQALVLCDTREFAQSAQTTISKLEVRLKNVETTIKAEEELQQSRAKNAQRLAGEYSIAKTYSL